MNPRMGEERGHVLPAPHPPARGAGLHPEGAGLSPGRETLPCCAKWRFSCCLCVSAAGVIPKGAQCGCPVMTPPVCARSWLWVHSLGAPALVSQCTEQALGEMHHCTVFVLGFGQTAGLGACKYLLPCFRCFSPFFFAQIGGHMLGLPGYPTAPFPVTEILWAQLATCLFLFPDTALSCLIISKTEY